MPGARLGTFRFGDNFELLTEFVLSAMAFTTRVPRQEDIGNDFFCVLSERENKLLKAGPFFTVQAKNKRKKLVFSKKHELDWIKNQENPFFICIADAASLTVNIYSTWIMQMGFLSKDARKVVLIPGGLKDDYEEVKTKEDLSEQLIPLGKPILQITASDAMDRKRMEEFTAVLREWVVLDRQNIINRYAGMHWVVGPRHWETNRLLSTNFEGLTAFFWNAQNLQQCLVNFGRTATALRLTIRWAYGSDLESQPELQKAISSLDMALKTHAVYLEPLAKKVLREVIGLDIEQQ